MQQHVLKIQGLFSLESGHTLPEVTIAYTTYGRLNTDKSNVVWVFHALTGTSAVTDWWAGLFGEGRFFDPSRHFIVCANMLGSCYGSSCPDGVLITIRDMVEAHKRLKNHLGIDKVWVGIGGSMGGQQLVEWAVQEPGLFEFIVPMATNAVHSAWGIAFNEAQRMALQHPDPQMGMAAARAIGMLSYRSYDIYNQKQTDADERLDGFSASSYQQYQGKKLASRFTQEAYISLSKSMDSHDIGRGRGSREEVLQKMESRAIVFGFSTDLLFPVVEQAFIAEHIPNSVLHVLNSPYAHDGFLVETERIEAILAEELNT